MARSRTPKRLNTFTATLIGDWAGVEKYFANLGIEVKKKTLQAQWEVCKKLKQKVIGHLLAQDLDWKDFSPKYRARKKENKDLKLISTEVYLDNIKVWKTRNGAFVGVKKGKFYRRKSGAIGLDRIAIWNEYGTMGKHPVPARPLWNPSIEELGGKEGIRNYIVDAIFRRLKWLARGKPIKVTKKQVSKMIE